MRRLAWPLRARTRRSARTAERDEVVRFLTCALASMVLLLAGCSREAATSASAAAPANSPSASTQPAPFLLQASIKELMDAQVDPSADVIWESVYTRISPAGREDHQPHTPE